jgi:hypothetical protein
MINVSYLSDRLARRTHVAQEAGLEAHREADEPTPVTPALTIALARQAGTPAEEIALEVSGRLGWPIYSHELLERISQDLHVPVQNLERIDERGVGWVLEYIQGFGQAGQVSEELYVHRLAALIRALGARGRCILVGRGAAQILPPETTLRVSLIGNLKDRIEAVSRSQHLSREQAARKLNDRTRARVRFIRNHFYKDPTTPDNYDLVLNTSAWTPSACATMIEQALELKARSPAVAPVA